MNSEADAILDILPPMRARLFVQILSEVTDYAHEMMNIPEMWTRTRGAGYRCVVLDSGIPDHPDLSFDASKCASFVPDYSIDSCGHASHVGGIIAATANNSMGIAGIAPEVEDLYGAVLNGRGQGSIRWIVNGIRWAVDVAGADLINLSLGLPDGMPHSRDMEAACNYAADQGVTVIAAAGNEYGRVGQPAKYDSVIAVAAVDSKKDHAKFSNTGPQVDFAAAGVDVYSTYLRKGYAKLSGSSMAAPAIAGVACLLGAEYKNTHGGARPGVDEIRRRLRKIAFDVGTDGFDDVFGHGIPIFRPGIDWNAPTTQPAVPPTPTSPAEPPNITPVPDAPSEPSAPRPGRSDPCKSFRRAAAQGLSAAAAGVRTGQDPTEVLASFLDSAAEFMRRAGAQP